MKNIRRFAIASVALALGLPAVAQNAETANSTTTARRLSPAPAPAYTTHNSGSAKAVLAPFGPYITQTGVGVNGNNVSELYTTFTLGAVGYNIYGYGMQGTAANVLAADFTVPALQTWTVSGLKWLTYQTGAPTTGTITGMTLNLWNTTPTVVGGATWAGGNVWTGNAFTGVYRVLDSGLLASGRAIIEATCSAGWVPALGAGTYWLDATATGSLASGPWGPVCVKAGQTPPTGDPWNGMQAVGGGAFSFVFDTGFPAGSINEPSDFLFQVEGTGGGGGGPAKFCTSKPSSIPGCVPSLSGTSTTHSKGGGAGSYTVTATPVPGGNGKPGILIYTKAGLLGTPANTPFGFLCLSQFLRAGAFPQQCGGTSGTCSGTYNWDLGAMAPSLNYAAGDTLHIQAWYRDPTNPGTANFTEGIGPISVVP